MEEMAVKLPRARLGSRSMAPGLNAETRALLIDAACESEDAKVVERSIRLARKVLHLQLLSMSQLALFWVYVYLYVCAFEYVHFVP